MAHQDSKAYRGYIYIASSAFCWGISATLGRAAFTGRLLPGGQALRPIDPVILSQTRMTFAFLVFLPVLAISRGWKKLSVPVLDAVRLCLIGVIGLAGANYFYYLAIQRTNVATAITLQYTAPVWVLLYAIATRQQRPSLPRIVSVMLAVLGIVLVIGIFDRGNLRLDTVGLVAGIVAAFTFAFYSIAGRSLQALRSLAGTIVFNAGSIAALDRGQSPGENSGGKLLCRPMGISRRIRTGFIIGAVLSVFCRLEISRAHQRHGGQLS